MLPSTRSWRYAGRNQPFEANMNQTFTVTGMTCGHCEKALARAITEEGYAVAA